MAEMKFYGADPVVFESVSAVTATPSVNLGDRRLHKGEEYVYCYNAGGADASVNLGVKLITAASGYSVAQTSVTDTFNPVVGVVKHATITAGSYGWVLTKGFTSVLVNSATTGDYVPLALGASGKFILGSFSAGGTSAINAYALNANTGAGGTTYAFIRTGF